MSLIKDKIDNIRKLHKVTKKDDKPKEYLAIFKHLIIYAKKRKNEVYIGYMKSLNEDCKIKVRRIRV